MLTKFMRWISLFTLIGTAVFWSPGSSNAVILQFVICGSASLVAIDAARCGKHLWTAAFAGLAVLFNPLVRVTFSHSVFPWVTVFCWSIFLAALVFLKTAPRLSLASIAYSEQRAESL
jgi:uncharacterized protein DUF6804